MSSDNFDNIYKLLTEHNFEMNKNVPNKLKCVKCRKILINACQTRCGCRFCRNCVDEMMANECQVCPGNADDCRIGMLSDVQFDFRANKQISKLILKCPEKMCLQECELIKMEEHLKMCGKKSVKCPFYNMGCDQKKITSEMMNLHFQLENYNHSKILIGMIDNIKNDIVGLRVKENKNNKEIEKMKEYLKLKDEKIESINAEMELMKNEKIKLENRVKTLEEIVGDKIGEMEKEELEQQMEISLRNIWNKIDEFNIEMNKKCKNDKIESINEEIKLIKMEKNELIEKTKFLQQNVDNKMNEIEARNKKETESRNDEMNLIKMEKEELEKKMEISFGDLNRKMDEIVEMRQARQAMEQEMMEMRNEPRVNQLENFVKCQTDGIFEMAISNVDEWRNECEWTWSEYFHVRMQPYQLQLCMDPIYDDNADKLSIRLFIFHDAMNSQCKWPFKADVTIKIMNKNNPNAYKSITKNCQINQPAKNKCKTCYTFIYLYSDLTKNGTLESNCIIVQCSVVLKL